VRRAELDLSDLTSQAVDNLVTQFASHLDFYRELIQNSIDAGSTTIDAWMEFIPGEEDQGTIAIHVDDSGDGMTEAIIDGQLTKLFSSQKEGDLTKIGKFGIGFVSVFACKPKAVLVHTGRDGECWEVCFDADRSFVKTRLETPVDGTQITLFLAGDRGRYNELVTASRATLKRWCSHSDVEVTFEDRSRIDGGQIEAINEPFTVAGEPSIQVEVDGITITAAYSAAPVYGFYNKGLALAVSSDAAATLGELAPRFEHVAFKVKSHHFEHTLSRDTVVRNESYRRMMGLVSEAVAGALQDALVAEISALVAAKGWGLPEVSRYDRLIGALAREPAAEVARHAQAPLLRTLDGAPLTLAQVERAIHGDRLYLSDARSPVIDYLMKDGVAVIFARAPADEGGQEAFGAVGRLLIGYLAQTRLGGGERWAEFAQMLASPDRALFAVDVESPRDPEIDALIADAARLLAALPEAMAGVPRARLPGLRGRIGLREGRAPRPTYRRVVGARLVLGAEVGPLAVFAPTIGRYMARGSRRRGFGLNLNLSGVEAAVNVDHPQVEALARLRAREPALAAYCLAKDLLLADDRGDGLDEALLRAALPGIRGASRAKETV
jgi:hypothetical protein